MLGAPRATVGVSKRKDTSYSIIMASSTSDAPSPTASPHGLHPSVTLPPPLTAELLAQCPSLLQGESLDVQAEALRLFAHRYQSWRGLRASSNPDAQRRAQACDPPLLLARAVEQAKAKQQQKNPACLRGICQTARQGEPRRAIDSIIEEYECDVRQHRIVSRAV